MKIQVTFNEISKKLDVSFDNLYILGGYEQGFQNGINSSLEKLTELIIEPTKETRVIVPTDNNIGFNKVVANKIPEEYIIPNGKINITNTKEIDVSDYKKAQIVDENLKAENIAEGVEVLGITGTMKGAGADPLVALLEGTLEGTVTSYGCTTLKPYFFQGLSGLKEVNLPNLTTLHGTGYQFQNCSSLEKFTFGLITTIPERCFNNCSKLKEIDTPEVTVISYYTFTNCSNLRTINAPKVKTLNNYCFSGCESLLYADFPEAETIGYNVFANCYNLKSVNLPKLTSSYLSYTFSNCRNLENVNLPKVKSLSTRAFDGCSELKKIILQEVTSVGEFAFGYCTKLNDVCLPKLTSIGSRYTFYDCYNLKSLIITQENSVCTLSSSSAFEYCYHILGKVSDLYNPNGDKDGYIYVPDSLVDSYKSATNWSTYADAIKSLRELPQALREEFDIW